MLHSASLQVAAVVDSELLDRVFSSSPRLSSSAVEAFVAALCAVSLKELRIEGHLDHHDHREGAQTSSSSAATPSAAVDGSTAGGGSLRVLAMKGFPSFRSRDTGADLAQPRVFSLQKLVRHASSVCTWISELDLATISFCLVTSLLTCFVFASLAMSY